MNRCRRCGAPLRYGAKYCPPKKWLEKRDPDGARIKVRFYGCAIAATRRLGPRASGRSRLRVEQLAAPLDPLPSEGITALKVYPFARRGQLPDRSLEDLPIYSNVREGRYAAGSVWTNERYGWNWARFRRELLKVTTKLGVALIGCHVPTLIAADAVEDVLQGRRLG